MTAATIFAALGLQAAYLTAPIKIDTVLVGDAGNAADTGGAVGTGAVAYDYYIGTTEVTAGQYAAFLNAVASKSDINGLYNTMMVTDTYGCGIVKTTVDGVSTYSASKGDNIPVNFVSAYDAMRFCNWLSTGNTETGIYIFNGEANNIGLVTRNDTAWQAGGIAIASIDEWYKAAFYQGDGTYSKFANGRSDNVLENEANFSLSGIGTITDVDFGAASHYGTFGQNGNVWEWTDTVSGTGTSLFLRGGNFNSPDTHLSNSFHTNLVPAFEDDGGVGFRVTSLQSIPEPGTYAAIFGALALAVAIYSRRK